MTTPLPGSMPSSLVAVAERLLRIKTIATLDRRHFGAAPAEPLEELTIVPPRLEQAAAVSFVASR